MHHSQSAGHPVIQSYEPGENWFWDYDLVDYVSGPTLPPPHAHPAEQPVPGPAGAVPRDWAARLHS